MTIILTGMSGCGKTSLGSKAAREQGWRFSDTDAHVEKTAGLSVAEIFTLEGERGFRAREHAALKVLTRKGGLISTGGGIITKPYNREILANFPVIYLRSSADKILSNLKNDKTRPLLGGNENAKRAKIERLLTEREKLYEQTAGFIVDVDCGFDEALAKLTASITLALM